MKIGLEKEFFIFKKHDNIVSVSDETILSYFIEHQESSQKELTPISAKEASLDSFCDECGYLAEIRGEPCSNIVSAIFSLREKEFRLRRMLKKDVAIVAIPYYKIPAKLLHSFRREFGKGAAHDESMYSEVKQKTYQTAGLHVHFSDEITVYKKCKCGATIETEQATQINMPRIIKKLDEFFKEVIKKSKRQKGIYEMKPWGFEYRSLPNNVDENLLIEFFEKILKNNS